MDYFLSHLPRPEFSERARDIDRQTRNREKEIAGLMKRYRHEPGVLAVLKAAIHFNSNAGDEEIRAIYMEDYHIRDGMSADQQDLARAQVVEPEGNLAAIHRGIRDTLLKAVLNIDDKIDQALTPRRYS